MMTFDRLKRRENGEVVRWWKMVVRLGSVLTVCIPVKKNVLTEEVIK